MAATVAPAAAADLCTETAELLTKLSLDAQPKPLEIPEPTKKPYVYQYGSVDSNNAANGQVASFDRSTTPLIQDFMDPTMCYLPNGYPSAYYYGGFDGTGTEWEDYTRYMSSDGVDLTSGVYGDNGSLMYHHGYGYASYAPYSPAASPVPTMANDGQLYGPQHYQYPPYVQPVTPNNGPFTPSAAPQSQGELSAAAVADQKPLPVEAANTNSNGVANGTSVKMNTGSVPVKSSYKSTAVLNNSYGRGTLPGAIPSSGYQDPRYGFDGFRSPIPWLDGSMYSDIQHRPFASTGIASSYSKGNNASLRNASFRPNSNYIGLQHHAPMSSIGTAHGYVNRMYPNKLYGQYGTALRSGMGFASNGYDYRTTGRGWLAADKFKPRGRVNGYYGSGNEDGLNELNRGPRAKGPKNLKGTELTTTVKVQDLSAEVIDCEEKEKVQTLPARDEYNREDFPVEYTDAKFFVIKSYSEDDVHKSIKYSVWASTPNGNKKLDAAYQEAQQKTGGCPIFLFFSVNTSGQFVGLAEMVGPVDFQKNVEYWQQDKWTGCFPVKWHIVKDVPNNCLKHITLENNENKPVTNSRDTQEVRMEQGLKIVKIFKDHSSRTCILDDFEFYEVRQKAIQEKKVKQQQQGQKQLWEGKPAEDKPLANGLQKSVGAPPDFNKDPSSGAQSNGVLQPAETGSAPKLADVSKVAKPVVVSGKKELVNGIANGC